MKPSSPTAPIAAPAPTRPRPRRPSPVPAKSRGAKKAPATPAPVTSQSPVWSGGGVVFGPHPRDYSKKTNKTVKQLALRKAISSRVNAGEVYLIDPITLDKPKTKDLVAKLKDGVRREDDARSSSSRTPDQNLYLASRNHPRLETITGDLVNAEQLLRYDKIFITDGALGKLSARLQK